MKDLEKQILLNIYKRRKLVISLKNCKLFGQKLSSDLCSRYNSIYNKYINFIGYFDKGKDYDFTEHGAQHSKRVKDLIEEILKLHTSSAKAKLSNLEAYILGVSALLHDIGMNKAVKFKSDGFIDFFETRYHHSELSTEIIDQRFIDDIDPASTELKEMVKDVMRAHRSQKFIDINSLSEEIDYSGETIRVRYLGAILRICDEFDNDFRRAPRLTKEIIGEMNELGKKYWDASQAIASINFKEKGKIKISFQRNFDSVQRLNSYKLLISKMNEELKYLVSIFSSQGLTTNTILVNELNLKVIDKVNNFLKDYNEKVRDFFYVLLLNNEISEESCFFGKDFRFSFGRIKYQLFNLNHHSQKNKLKELSQELGNKEGVIVFYCDEDLISDIKDLFSIKYINYEENLHQMLDRI